MILQGIVSEEKVDAFNLPVYHMSAKELEAGVERNGSFSIERMESVPALINSSQIKNSSIGRRHLTGKAASLLTRAAFEGVTKAQFGVEILDQLLDLFSVKLVHEFPLSDLVEKPLHF